MTTIELINNIIAQLTELKDKLEKRDTKDDREQAEPKELTPNTDKDTHKREHKNFLNKSKFLNEEQREIVLAYINNDDNIAKILELPSHKRIAYVQKQLQEQHGIQLSFYMTQKLLKKMKKVEEHPTLI